MTTIEMITAILVFFSVALADYFWTRYIQCVDEQQASKSGLYAALIILVGAFATRSYVNDIWLIIPASLGAYVGTYLTVRSHKE
jgi:hypothetical protein